MSLVGNVTQQSHDVQDYDIDFSEWFPEGDIITTASIFVIPEMPIPAAYAIKHPRVKIWVYAGGITGTVYKVTMRATTLAGRTKEIDLNIRIKDI